MVNRERLVQQFLTDDNHIKWGALGMALTGGTVYSVAIGVGQGILSVGATIDLFVGDLVGTFLSQVTRFFDAANRQLGEMWTLGIDLWVFQLPFNLVIVLVAFTILTLGVSHFTDG